MIVPHYGKMLFLQTEHHPASLVLVHLLIIMTTMNFMLLQKVAHCYMLKNGNMFVLYLITKLKKNQRLSLSMVIRWCCLILRVLLLKFIPQAVAVLIFLLVKEFQENGEHWDATIHVLVIGEQLYPNFQVVRSTMEDG